MSECSIPHSKKEYNQTFTETEIQRTIRFAVASKYESIQIYEEISEILKDETSRNLMEEIILDEKKHIGSFIKLLENLNSFDENYINSL